VVLTAAHCVVGIAEAPYRNYKVATGTISLTSSIMLPLIFLVVGVLAQQTFAEEPEAIVGGTVAAPGEFPYQISLRNYGDHVCGGSIIIVPGKKELRVVLTAAHCVVGIAEAPYRNYKVATGTISLTGGQIHNVKKIIVNPDYSDRAEDAWKNDIAVIILDQPIKPNNFQSGIELTRIRPTPGQQCTLSGWGQISTHGPLPRELLKMNQAVVAQSLCQESHYEMPLTGSHLCTLNRYGIGACSGDSGGPLVCNGKQCGVTSWVLPCAKGEPDVYTDVSYHYNWVIKTANAYA
jgi:trypsin